MAMLIAKKSTRQKILLAALIAASGTIPLLNNINSIALIILVFACLIQEPWSVTKQKLSVPGLWALPVIYFLWICCSYFWDSTGGFLVRDVERYAMLFFIPVALAIVPRISPRIIKMVLTVFIGVTITVCSICLIKSYIEYQATQDYRVFFYHYLASQMDLNAIFLSNYCLAGIIWLLYYTFILPQSHSRPAYVKNIAGCIFLFAMILMLSSKLIIFLTFLLLLFFILIIGYKRGYFLRTVFMALVLIASVLVAVNNIEYLKWRINETSFKKYESQADDQNGLSIRRLMWSTAWNLIKEKPILGYGVKGARVVVVQKYREQNFMMGYTQGYHSHNQYLQSALIGGIPAVLLLLAMLLKMCWDGWRKQNTLLLVLLLHFMLQSVIESTFEVQQELVFYILFLFLFYYHPPFPVKNTEHHILRPDDHHALL